MINLTDRRISNAPFIQYYLLSSVNKFQTLKGVWISSKLFNNLNLNLFKSEMCEEMENF